MINGYNFTERVRKVLAMAREEAVALHHDFVGTEHMLLGVLREGGGVGVGAIRALGVDLEALRERVVSAAGRGTAREATGPDLPYQSRAKKVLELAMSEARELGHSYVGTEHLLLGLLREEQGVAAQSLNAVGITTAKARAEVRRRLGARSDDAAAMAADDARAREGAASLEVEVSLRRADGSWTRHAFPGARAAIRFLEGLDGET